MEIIQAGGDEFVSRHLSNPRNYDLFDRVEYLHLSDFRRAHHVLAVEQDGMVVGDISLEQSPYEEDEIWFMHIAVDPDHQNQGVARRLFQGACAYVASLGEEKWLRISDLSDEGKKHLPRMIAELNDHYPGLLRNLQGCAEEQVGISSPSWT